MLHDEGGINEGFRTQLLDMTRHIHYGTVSRNAPLGRPVLSNDRICTQGMDLTRHDR